MTEDLIERIGSDIDHVRRQMESILPKPLFPITIYKCASYESLFTGESESQTDIDGLLNDALKHGRVILHAEGGSGKTVTLMRVFRAATEQGMVPVFVDLRKWQPNHFEQWEAYRDNDLLRIDLLLHDLGEPQVTEAILSELPSARARLVLTDGLSEVPSGVAAQVLRVLETFAQRNPQSGVIAADRLVRRPLPSKRWLLTTIAPISGVVLHDLLSGDHQVIPTAFFVNLALSEGIESGSSSIAFDNYFRQQLEISSANLDTASRAAFEMYQRYRSRTFTLSSFVSVAGEELSALLIDAGVIITDGLTAYFKHHLLQDYLAACYLSGDPLRWTNDAFDAVTFNASSFEVLGLALEQVPSVTSADALLRRIYDWNFYGSAYALARGQSLGTVNVSEAMEVALLAMLAERRWDLLKQTAERVEDALRIFKSSELAHRLLQASSHREVIAIIDRMQIEDSQFHSWKGLYTADSGSNATSEILAYLPNDDSLMGWTAANVLKRLAMDVAQQGHVRSLLREGDPTVRWRASHVLGAFPSEENADALIQALSDDYHWVRYGAVRSVVEMAARDSELRSLIFSRLQAKLGELASDRGTLQEFERALQISSQPTDWPQAVAPILEDLWAASKTTEQQDHWRELARSIQRTTATP